MNANTEPATSTAGSEHELSLIHISIGQVLSQLDLEFPGISASKIRFLEERGLVHPSRTETGYRKYSQTDIERLRYILTMQRDHYMPLKVIRQHLEDMEAGRVLNSMPATVSEDCLLYTSRCV